MSEAPAATSSWLNPDSTAWVSGTGGLANNGTGLGTFPPESLAPSQMPLFVNPWDIVLCTSGTLIACENALVVLVIWQNPALRAPMFLLIGSLALADLLAGLGLVLHFTCAYLLRSDAAQLLTVGLVVASFSASVFSLLAITIDRYLSLYYALTYNSERTAAFTYTMLVLLWGLSLCLGLLPVTGGQLPGRGGHVQCGAAADEKQHCRPFRLLLAALRSHAATLRPDLQDCDAPRSPDRPSTSFLGRHATLRHDAEGRVHAGNHPGYLCRLLDAIYRLFPHCRLHLPPALHLRYPGACYLQLCHQPGHLRLQEPGDPEGAVAGVLWMRAS
ncbi:hypothetical protein fugu_015964 [Takifugu bimaculatus]|uniref:G-protein coupled receptors family 1 profile domain-containing protein n=1 Tax=Takifugu bimaculatus TaxID=433685 RepID=A0A4Z2BVQ8_9TELE|nr:hypothetical protein fugu_015964 [Takifugu bimaculatus]